ncbi:MAG: hypothetical protein Q8K60_00275 [Parachlamydiaceae bacterium]|nr:hypothetical protein [Parachlamydiaceae bacterium]
MNISFSNINRQSSIIPQNDPLDLMDLIEESRNIISSHIPDLKKLLRHLTLITKKFYDAFEKDLIHTLSQEIDDVRQLHQSIIDKYYGINRVELAYFNELASWVHQFNWLFLVIKQNEYVKVSCTKNTKWENDIDQFYYFYHTLTIRENALELPWDKFREIFTSLIINFFHKDSKYLFFSTEGKEIYLNYKLLLLFFEHKEASPKELIQLVTISSSLENKEIKCLQADLRIAFNVKQSFPTEIKLENVSLDLFKTALKIQTLFKHQYTYYSSHELFFSLKILDHYYQGNPKTLIEYQNIVHFLNSKQKIKTIHKRDLLFKETINEFLLTFKRKNQKLKIIGSHFEPIFSLKLLKTLLNLDLKPDCYCSYINLWDSSLKIEKKIQMGTFFDIFLFSLNPEKEHTFSEIIQNQYFVDKSLKRSYQINCSENVFQLANDFFEKRWYSNKDLDALNTKDKIDLLFLASRANKRIKPLEKELKELLLQEKDWKNAFLQLIVSYNH